MSNVPTDQHLPPSGRDPRAASSSAGFFRGAIVLAVLAVVSLAGANVWLHSQRREYRAEIDRLRASMTTLERSRADAIVARDENSVRLGIALLRRQAQIDDALHLTVSLDSGVMHLEREGVVLREMPVEIGPERRVGLPPDTVQLASPRGVRTVARVLADTSRWEVPAWVYADRGVPLDSARVAAGTLGSPALVLDGGTVIYSQPLHGPLADSTYVLPGSLRLREQDLRAVLPNITPGVRIYFY